MAKHTFIPKKYRPVVPGSRLQSPVLDLPRKKISGGASESSILFLSAKDDIVPAYFLKEIDSRAILHFFYDELGISWDYSFYKNILKIHSQERVIEPLAIYHRHPGVSKNHMYFQKHAAFFEILDIWCGNLLGQKRDHYQNFSKGYQGITSLKNANTTICQKVKYPRSFFLKGSPSLIKQRFKGSLIVKSSSNIRSMVVSEKVFKKWDTKNLYNLPTFFQEEIIGEDIRVHICEEAIWALLIENKDCTDYRYASKNAVRYKEIELPEYLIKYCKSVSKIEKNNFIGIDLMKNGSSYFCLESNPGPGWSTYQHPSKKEFAEKLLKQLSRK